MEKLKEIHLILNYSEKWKLKLVFEYWILVNLFKIRFKYLKVKSLFIFIL